jgi:hypothetical protein
MADLHDIVEGVQDALGNLTPTPVIITEESTAYDLKTRLEWGEPALSIVDIRKHEAFDRGRITGAMSMPMEQLAEMKSALQPDRDIYIYGDKGVNYFRRDLGVVVLIAIIISVIRRLDRLGGALRDRIPVLNPATSA